MARAVRSDEEDPVEVRTVADLDKFIEHAESRAARPVAISIDAHGCRADILVGYHLSFVHLSPDEPGRPYHVTVGGPPEGGVDFWLHSLHHTWFEARHLIQKDAARQALREFFVSGRLSTTVQWENYTA
jgi:hypothetical protein